jgi:hypothetical protein
MRLFGTILQVPIGTVVPLSRSAFFNRTGLGLPYVSLSWWSLPLSDTITNPLPLPLLAVRHRPQSQAALRCAGHCSATVGRQVLPLRVHG